MKLLALEGVVMEFGGLKAIDGLSMEVGAGTIHGLIGPNGSGKTSTMNVISGTYLPNGGSVRFGGAILDGLPPHRIAALGLSRTFQAVQLFAGLTVVENVMTGRHLKTNAGMLSSMLRLPGAIAEERASRAQAAKVLAFLGLEAYAEAPCTGLPYGVQRLVELARALAAEPRLLLLDEPAAGMNGTETARLDATLRRLRDEKGISILLVEHDMPLVMKVCDVITVLNFGKKIAEGTPQEVRRSQAVIEAYLGVEESAPAH